MMDSGQLSPLVVCKQVRFELYQLLCESNQQFNAGTVARPAARTAELPSVREIRLKDLMT